MGLTRSELDAMRALVRSRSGLPAPPPRPALWNLEAGEPSEVQPTPTTPAGDTPACAAPTLAEPAPPRVVATLESEAEALSDAWRPDDTVHRLVELLIEMRRLSSGAQAESDRLAKAA